MINRDPVPLRPQSRRRNLLSIVFFAVSILLFMARSIATFWTDFLWFDSLSLSGVWRTLVFTQVWIVIICGITAGVLVWLNLWLAARLAPPMPLATGIHTDERIERFQDWVGPREGWVRIGVSALLGLLLGLLAAPWWGDFLMYRYGTEFGIADPIFNNDISLYVFDLPLYQSVFSWALLVLIFVTIAVGLAHFFNGGIQFDEQVRRVSAGVKVHVSVLFALIALLKAVGYQLDQWGLLQSRRGQVVGASYTDVNAQLPALRLLVVISIVAAIIMLVNIWFRGWTLPLVALGLWLLTSIGVGGAYPWFVQRFQVQPNEVEREVEFVAHNIEFTNEAFGLADIQVRTFEEEEVLDRQAIDANRQTIDNIRLWDPAVLQNTYRELQEIKTYYRIDDVDVDRYIIDGELTQVMVSARELDEENIPGGGWVNNSLVYTHGFGAVVSPANDVSVEGQPAFFVKDIPPETNVEELTVTQPRIYFSDSSDPDYLIVNTNEPEIDFPLNESQVELNNYDGTGGVELGNWLRRAAWGLRFWNLDVLISNEPTAESRALIARNIRDRVNRVAPFLHSDADPYLVLIDGDLVWVLDLYTVSDAFPYSSTAITDRLARTSGLPSGFNYIRNPVKATVNAYTGEMTFHVIDQSDPLIQTQMRIFPELFSTDPIPMNLQEHLRYPEDMFRVQSDMYLRYHMTESTNFFRNVDPWQIALDPSTSEREALRGPVRNANGESVRKMLPYYLLMKLPGEDELSFLAMQPFTPLEKPNMVSFLVAKSGPADYGEIIDYRLPEGSSQQGPEQVGNFINQDPVISQQFTLLGQAGSEIIQGNMLVVPIEQSLLYVQPIYIQARPDSAAAGGSTVAQGDSAGIPEFKRVVISYDGEIKMAESLDEALAAIFGGGGGVTGDGDGETSVPDDVVQLLAAADRAFTDAEEALAAGNLGAYQDALDRARTLVERAVAELATAGT